MNERIRELAGQLGPIAKIGNWGRVEWADNVYPQIGDRLYAAIDLEKFAQLIALECARLAMTEHHSTSPAEYDEMEPYEQGCDDTASAISGKIRRIFGVE